jgi:hypothetical protein
VTVGLEVCAVPITIAVEAERTRLPNPFQVRLFRLEHNSVSDPPVAVGIGNTGGLRAMSLDVPERDGFVRENPPHDTARGQLSQLCHARYRKVYSHPRFAISLCQELLAAISGP